MPQGQREVLRQWLGDLTGRVDAVSDPSGTYLSLRVMGLEIGRLEGQLAPRVYWGLEGNCRRLEARNRDESRDFVGRVLELRAPHCPDRSHEYFRLQSEWWLERLLVGDLAKIDPALSPVGVYPQVPRFLGHGTPSD